MAPSIKSVALVGMFIVALLYVNQIHPNINLNNHIHYPTKERVNALFNYMGSIKSAIAARAGNAHSGNNHYLGLLNSLIGASSPPVSPPSTAPKANSGHRYQRVSTGNGFIVHVKPKAMVMTTNSKISKHNSPTHGAFPKGPPLPAIAEKGENQGQRYHPNIDQVSVDWEIRFKGQKARIPHIIHQTWDDNQVPQMFVPWMQSWTAKHPDWEYWFWTQNDVRRLLSQCYPSFLNDYDSYEKDIYRANAMRFYIMYHFGGVYADLDLESLKPMDPWTFTEDCILPEETFVHPIILRQQKQSNVMITLLACRAQHPFFKLAIDMLPTYKSLKYETKLMFVDTVYRKFISSKQEVNNRVAVVHPDYFLPTYDKGLSSYIQTICLHVSTLSSHQKNVCDILRKEHFMNVPKAKSFTNHYWVHVMMKSEAWKRRNTRPISSIISNATNMQAMLSTLKCVP